MKHFFKRLWVLVRDPVGFTSNVAFVGGVLAIVLHACSRQVVEEAQAKEEPATNNALCAAYPPGGEFLQLASQFHNESRARHRACFRVGEEIQCWELFACKR
jgi:hypothetical protein